MAAYLHTVIDGNKSFGGYLSVDGEKAFAVNDDTTYELSPGHHYFVLYSTSNIERAHGKLQATLYNNTSSKGAIVDALERRSIMKDIGDGWEFNVMVEENQVLTINVLSKGNKIVSAPLSDITDLTDEEAEELEQRFTEWKNTPIRSKKQITWGIVIAAAGAFGTYNTITVPPVDTQGILIGLSITAVGLLIFLLGMRKKIRRK